MRTGDGVPDDDLVTRRDQIVDDEVQVGIDRVEHRPHLLELVRPRRVDGQRRADLRIRQDELVDCLREGINIVGVQRVVETLERRDVSCLLGAGQR